MQLDINTDAVVALANRLERMSRSALPVAVRSALNSTAFHVKTKTMPVNADNTFLKRQANFFKANSKVLPATGFNINAMHSTVGFVPLSGTNRAVDDLEEQEHGGDIGGRSFIPLKEARVSKAWNKNVKANFRIGDIKNKIVDAHKSEGSNDAEKFTRSAIHAGKGGFVLGTHETGAGNRILFQINSIKRIGRNTVIKSTPLYAVKGGRSVAVKGTHFMENATLEASKKMESFYIIAAEKQLKRNR